MEDGHYNPVNRLFIRVADLDEVLKRNKMEYKVKICILGWCSWPVETNSGNDRNAETILFIGWKLTVDNSDLPKEIVEVTNYSIAVVYRLIPSDSQGLQNLL